MAEPVGIKRCAVYTRKSSEEGLEQDFNSLHAQREACEAYVLSQRGEGWKLVPTHYDDGGLSGGTMERPALRHLMSDIEAGKIDVVVVYKVDRLTRSLSDFSKMVEVFDRKGVSFVAVTQHFNTTTSMGRLTLNVLLSFAQFEREVTGERIRDKIAASKKKGMWMGGMVPLGYRVEDRKLVVVPEEAEAVRQIYQRYLSCPGFYELVEVLRQAGIRPRERNGHVSPTFSRGALYLMLSNPLYIGEVAFQGNRYPGQHEGIVDVQVWNTVQETLKAGGPRRGHANRKTEFSPLMGKIFDEEDRPLSPSHAVKDARRYRYYVSRPDEEGRAKWRLPAREVESRVIGMVRKIEADRALILKAAEEQGLGSAQVRDVLDASDKLGHRSLQWVDKVKIHSDRITIRVKLPGPHKANLDVTEDMQVRHSAGQRKLVVAGAFTLQPNARLVRVLGHGLQFWERLCRDPDLTTTDIGKQEKLDRPYVGRTLPLAFIAPDIVAMMLAGKQAPEWTGEKALRLQALPLRWADQRRLFSASS